MRRSALVVTLAVLLVLQVSAAPAAATPTHSGTVIEIQVQGNGDARWSVSARYNLSDANDTAAFERVRTAFESGGSDVGIPVSVFREAAASVSERTDRPMEITGVNRSSRVDVQNDTTVGVLTLEFTWTNFATVEGETIAVGSAFTGGWFGDLGESQTLIIQPPSGYRVQTATPSTDIVGGALQWDGPEAFEPGQPSVEFQPPSTPTTSTTTPPPENLIPGGYPAIGLGVLVLAGLLLLAWQGGYLGGTRREGDEGDEPPDDAVGNTNVEEGVTQPDETATGAPTGDVTAADPEPADTAEPEDMELLSDEERVEHILRQHGGRMKQAQIVEETQWSNAKVSQLLSSMAEDERVEKLRIGRENLISLPDEDEP